MKKKEKIVVAVCPACGFGLAKIHGDKATCSRCSNVWNRHAARRQGRT